MALTLVTTAGAADANSYMTVEEANLYHEGRFPLDPAWDDAESKEALLVMGTKGLDSAFRGTKTLIVEPGGRSYYRIGRKWLGTTVDAVQKLSWPRLGLYHDNGAEVAANEIPWELKDALAEYAGQLGTTDRWLDNDAYRLGIQSIKAGSVAVAFKNGWVAAAGGLPQSVIDMIPPSWYTEEVDEATIGAEFEVVLPQCHPYWP